MKKRELGIRNAADLDELIVQITIGANGNDEQFGALLRAFEGNIDLPCGGAVAGGAVRVLRRGVTLRRFENGWAR